MKIRILSFTWELPPPRASKRTLVSKGIRLLTTKPLTCRWISVAADSRRCKCTSKKKSKEIIR